MQSRPFFKRLTQSVVTLRFTILSLFLSLFGLSFLLIIFITAKIFFSSISYTAFELMKTSSNAIVHQITEGLRPVQVESTLAAKLMQEGILQANEANLVPYTFYLTQTIPLVQSAFWGDKTGLVILATRLADGTIASYIYHLELNPNTLTVITRNKAGQIINQTTSTGTYQDPRKQSWYKKAKERHGTMWSGLFKFLYYPHLLGTGTVSPVYDSSENLRGEFGLALTLKYLSDYLTTQQIRKNGFAFIVDQKEQLIAYPNHAPFNQIKIPDNEILNIHHSKLKIIDYSLDQYKKTKVRQFYFSFEGEKYLVSYEPVLELANEGWLIGILVPEKDFVGTLENRFLALLGIFLLIMIAGIYITSIIVKRIVQPIKALVSETEKIQHFDLDDKIVINSRIKEVIDLRNAMESMKLGLKSFQRYVPTELVQKLIASGIDVKIGGERKKLAIFFSDVENFTTISEHVDPTQLLIQTSEYFEALSAIIANTQGTIDKYIGDSIMAFWGAPTSVAHPCIKAAHAALACKKASDELNKRWKKEGKPELVTRIGINYGDALVGNVGSSWRLNYTTLGDAVNIGSRLEQINKTYQTHIIVSHSVYEEIKYEFTLRLIDYVAVKGRAGGDYIYELLGDRNVILDFDFTLYKEAFMEGFRAYQKEQWQIALLHFEKCISIYPADTIAPLYIARCLEHKKPSLTS